MYYRSSATVTRNEILPAESSLAGFTNSLTNPTKSDKNTRMHSKQLRSQLDEHLSDLRSKERSFFSPRILNNSVSETPVYDLSPGSPALYQIQPNFINSVNGCTQLQELPDYQLGDCNAEVSLINSLPQHTFEQPDSPRTECEDIFQTKAAILSPLSSCCSPSHSLSPVFRLFDAESSECTLTPDTAVSPYSNEIGILSNET